MGEDLEGLQNWMLFAYGGIWDLGNGLRFCEDILDMSPSDVMAMSGIYKPDSTRGRRRIAEFICKKLGITNKNAHNYEINRKILPTRK